MVAAGYSLFALIGKTISQKYEFRQHEYVIGRDLFTCALRTPCTRASTRKRWVQVISAFEKQYNHEQQVILRHVCAAM
jgi:hypothetical protein